MILVICDMCDEKTNPSIAKRQWFEVDIDGTIQNICPNCIKRVKKLLHSKKHKIEAEVKDGNTPQKAETQRGNSSNNTQRIS